MKWSIIILIVLGLLAAFATAVLVGVLQIKPTGSANGKLSSEVEIILTKTALPAMSVINSEDIITKTVPRAELTKGYCSNPAQVIGRVLAVSVVKDQVLTTSCFVSQGSLPQLAAAIPHGMRAISVILPNNTITGGLLYPGCIVDILASFRLPSRDRSKGQALSATLLQGIQILAVENVSVVSQKNDEQASTKKGANNAAKKLTVTLMVNPRQAEALQLAREYGKLSVVMRNPLDRKTTDSDATILSEGQLAKFGDLLNPESLTEPEKDNLLDEIDNSMAEEDTGPVFMGVSKRKREAKKAPRWGVTVIRGSDVQLQELDIATKKRIVSWESTEKVDAENREAF
ncbi:MAG: Flp pilus assembly protein CpaB [Planctomycetota bacterium]|jgi:pilus assembly protein CpaB